MTAGLEPVCLLSDWIVMETLSTLTGDACGIYKAATIEPYIVRPAIPILYFGNSERYFTSPLKVVTVALNPSRIEFPTSNPFCRFPAAAKLGPELNEPGATQIIKRALDDYFCGQPYRPWFAAFEPLLKGLDASYYGSCPSTALHTDIGSPLATDPTWSRLADHARFKLQASGRPLWHRLIEALQPDAIILSTARHHRDKIELAPAGEWKYIWSRSHKQNGEAAKKVYTVEGRWLRLRSGKETLLVFGPASVKPFGLVSNEQKGAIGRAIREVLNGR